MRFQGYQVRRVLGCASDSAELNTSSRESMPVVIVVTHVKTLKPLSFIPVTTAEAVMIEGAGTLADVGGQPGELLSPALPAAATNRHRQPTRPT